MYRRKQLYRTVSSSLSSLPYIIVHISGTEPYIDVRKHDYILVPLYLAKHSGS